VRAYNYFEKRPMEVFATGETQLALKREFSYIFSGPAYPGIPQINLNTITAGEPFSINGLMITPIKLLHYKLEVLGYRIGDFTYITDASYIEPEELEKARGSKALTLNALRHEPHISHYTLSEAIEVGKSAQVDDVYFTHISHQLGLHDVVDSDLPQGMHLAYDGLVLEL
jgi:phosphoribosyl 1,2-cyclic phosphate phosphodiesterase